MSENGTQASSKAAYDPGLPVRKYGELSPEQYIEERLNDQLRYYDRTATRAKKRYLQSRLVSVIAAALVPVLINVKFPFSDYVTTALSVLVVLIVSLESVFHFREQWVNSRSTSEALRKEYFQFTSSEGPYATFGGDGNAAFRHFVGRAESMIEVENLSTLQVMTREAAQDKGPVTPPGAQPTAPDGSQP